MKRYTTSADLTQSNECDGRVSQSSLVIEVGAAETLVGHWRRRHDAAAGRGMPAHITILFPFRAPETIAQEVLQNLATLAARIPRHRYALVAIDEFKEAIYLRPYPDVWFRNLTQRLFEAFPDCPPYGGAFSDSIPHLTIAQTSGGEAHAALRLALDAAIATSLPVACEANALSLYVNDNSGDWTAAQRFQFA